jgi:hypothetical protein
VCCAALPPPASLASLPVLGRLLPVLGSLLVMSLPAVLHSVNLQGTAQCGIAQHSMA